MSTPRISVHKGRSIAISGASTSCMVWIDDKAALGIDRRFKSIAKARRAAVDYVERHTAAERFDSVDRKGRPCRMSVPAKVLP